MFKSPPFDRKLNLKDRSKLSDRLERASEHVLGECTKVPNTRSVQSLNIQCSTKREIKRTPSPQRSVISRKTTSSQARRVQLELEAARAKAKIQCELIDKQLEADLAMVGDDEDDERYSRTDKPHETVEEWMDKSHMKQMDCHYPGIATTMAPEPALATNAQESSHAPNPGLPVDSILHLAQTLKGMMTTSPPQENRLLTRLAIPKDLPNFSGDCVEWLHFKSAFNESTQICKFSEAENLWRLRRALKGEAKEAVTDLLIGNTPPDQVMEALELRFGRSDIVVQHLTYASEKATFFVFKLPTRSRQLFYKGKQLCSCITCN